MSRCVDLVAEDLFYVCKRMTEDERAQYEAMTGAPFDYRESALYFANLPGIKFTYLDDQDVPVCCGGYHEVSAGVWQSWMACTDEAFANHWRGITRHSRRVMQMLFDNGIRRLQTNALAGRKSARKWYEAGLKLTHEGTMRGFAANGEDVVIYAKVKEPDDVRQ